MPHQLGYQVRWDPALAQADREGPPQIVGAGIFHPSAGGEQEFSMRPFRWAIQNRGVDIVQPDLHYFGGFIRCTRVARMAAVAGMSCTVHMSGAGLGYLYVLHFASYVPNAGQHQEFKGAGSIPLECATSDLTCHNGSMRVPSGPGFGVTIAADYLRRASTVRL